MIGAGIIVGILAALDGSNWPEAVPPIGRPYVRYPRHFGKIFARSEPYRF
jgi:hypothetical protein